MRSTACCPCAAIAGQGRAPRIHAEASLSLSLMYCLEVPSWDNLFLLFTHAWCTARLSHWLVTEWRFTQHDERLSNETDE